MRTCANAYAPVALAAAQPPVQVPALAGVGDLAADAAARLGALRCERVYEATTSRIHGRRSRAGRGALPPATDQPNESVSLS